MINKQNPNTILPYFFTLSRVNFKKLIKSQKSMDINFIYQSVNVLQELDSKQRKI
jgi:hypothetical protein